MFKYLLPALVLVINGANAQNPDFKVAYVHPKTGLPGSIHFNASGGSRPSMEAPALWFREHLNANQDFKLVYDRTSTDQFGNSHIRYKQYYQSYKIEGAELILHSKNNSIFSMNGRFFPYLEMDTRYVLSSEDAYAKALNLFPNSVFIWEVPSEEKLLKYITGKASATYKPLPELLIYSKTDSCKNKDFRMAYKIDVYVYAPVHTRQLIYIDAVTGEILEQTEQICSIDRVGVAHTKYSGLQNITCDSIGMDSFVLVDHTRGKGIITKDVRIIGPNDSMRNFIDSNNIWDNFNEYKDEVATDVHFGAERTYDFYKSRFNRSSYDDSDAMIFNKVHFLNNYNNANWNGVSANFGDGDDINYRPLTSLDICSHELTHAVTGKTAGLRYMGESGALNESFSDVMAKAVEFETDSADMDWYIGGKISIKTKCLRNMSNPFEMGNPKYYYGKYYYKGSGDNGGVHYNSGVQNYWFYLLVDGGSGLREDGKPYKVESIGMRKASEVAYSNLTAFLSSFSEYVDACYLSLDAASMLFGENSFEYKQVRNAWYAVGLLDNVDVQSNTIEQSNWTVMPNPGNAQIQLYNPNNFELQTFEIVNMLGQTVMSSEFKSGDQIDVSSLDKGIYFIRIGYVTLKWVKG